MTNPPTLKVRRPAPDGGRWDTLVDVLRWRAEAQPDRVAFRFLADGEAETGSVTYGQLDRQARAVAGTLRERCRPGERALLLYPPGLEFIPAFFGCLYAGVVAVPLHCPRLNRHDERIQTVTANAQPAVALTTADLLARVEKQLHQTPYLRDLHRLATDDIPAAAADRWQPPAVSGDTLAFLQYTSGSTAAPRGVMVSHGNIMANMAMIREGFEFTPETVMVSWLPVYHDMGLIGNTLQPVYTGFVSIHMPPASFLQHPLRWLAAVCKYGATCVGAPNFAYDLCARKAMQRPDQLAALDLSRLDLAYCGAEPIRPETVRKFTEVFRACGFRPEAFYPCYGLAETTLFATGGRKADQPVMYSVRASELEDHRVRAADPGEDGAQALTGCGRVRLDERIVIANPETRVACQPGQVGEIWIAGSHVARGYWNDAARTAQTFDARLADSGDGPFLRTGDLGFLKDGELFVTGRIKDLIIIRGRNHYPQDIELTAERSHPCLRPGRGAAFGVEVGGEERLVVVHEVERERAEVDWDHVIQNVREAVALDHELAVHAVALVRAASIHTTTSGKIQRHAVRAAFRRGELLAYAAHPPLSAPPEKAGSAT